VDRGVPRHLFRKKWVPVLAIVSMIWTLVLLRLHMTDPIPLNF
jgi:hypothetical protein